MNIKLVGKFLGIGIAILTGLGSGVEAFSNQKKTAEVEKLIKKVEDLTEMLSQK